MLPALLLLCGPLVGAVDGEPGPQGLALSAGVSGGVVGGDVVAGVSVGVGVDTAPFSLHLQAPLLLRVVDVAPTIDPALPSTCVWLRCEELLAGERLDPTAIARLLVELRVFRPGDAVFFEAGRLAATLGSGAVVDRFTTAASWDRRTSGAYLALRLPWHHLEVDALVADVVSPGELIALRAALAPFDRGDGDENDDDLELAFETAVDAFAPVDVVDRFGELRPGDETRPLTSTSLSASLDVFEGAFALAPRLELGAVTGLSRNGDRTPWVGVGAGAGVDVGVDVGVVDARLRLTGSYGSAGWRRGLFSTLHLVERRAALVGATDDNTQEFVRGAGISGGGSGGLARVPAPGGPGLDARLEASAFDVVAPLLRLHLEEAPGGNAAEAGVVVDVDPVQVSLSLLRRGFVDVTGDAGVIGLDVDRVPLIGALEASWRFWGPLSLSVRWLRLPRFAGPSSGTGLRVDDDVLVTLSANTVLVPR